MVERDSIDLDYGADQQSNAFQDLALLQAYSWGHSHLSLTGHRYPLIILMISRLL